MKKKKVLTLAKLLKAKKFFDRELKTRKEVL